MRLLESALSEFKSVDSPSRQQSETERVERILSEAKQGPSKLIHRNRVVQRLAQAAKGPKTGESQILPWLPLLEELLGTLCAL